MDHWIKDKLDTHIRGFIAPFYGWITGTSILVTLLSIWVIATTWNIDSNFKNLLPDDSEASKAFTEASSRVGSSSSLFVVIDSPDMEANLDFARKYAEKLRSLPSVALAHFHNDKDFFNEHLLLYVSAERLAEFRRDLKERIKQKKREANPLFVSLDSKDKSAKADQGLLDQADFDKTKEKAKHADYKEYLVSDDKYSVTIIVRFVKSSTNLVATNNRLDRIRQIGQKLEPSAHHPEMKLQFGGGLADRKEEYNSIVSDIKYSAIFTVAGIFLLIGFFFGRLRAIAIVLTPLIMGVLWTLAIAFTIFGELTTISAFIFAIILGLGIDYGIHLLSSYDDYRGEGLDAIDALVECYTDTGRATIVGAVTTFLTFLIISFAEFKGLSQFGKVSSIGVIATLVAMLAVLPSFVLTLDALLGFTGSKQNSLLSKLYRHIKKTILAISNHRSESSETQTRPNLRADSSASAQKTDSVPGAARYALIAAALLTVGSIASLPLVGFEEDFNDIGHLEPFWGDNDEVLSSRQIYLKNIRRFGRRRAKYINDRAAEVRQQMSPETFKRKRQQQDLGSKYTTAVSNQVHSMPTILLFDSKENARRVYRHMDKLQSRGKLDTFRAVDSVYAFMPGSETEQRRRKAEMRKIKEVLKQQDLSVLSQKVRNKIETFRPKLDAEPFSVYQLPVWTKRLFREAGPEPKPASEGESFAFEYVIMVNPSIDMQEGDEARRFLQQIRRVKRETGIDFPVASQAFIYVSMIDHIKRDGPLMIGLTFLLVFGLLTYVFRDPARAAFALIPLTFGLLWMLGVCAWVGLRLNFFNVIIIPAVIGIGVDDGVHFYFRYLKYGRNSIRRSLETVGFAIIMTSLTSSIGFGGLAIADYAGLKSIGYLAIAGILSTLAATLLLVPSLLYVAEANGWQRLLPGESKRSD